MITNTPSSLSRDFFLFSFIFLIMSKHCHFSFMSLKMLTSSQEEGGSLDDSPHTTTFTDDDETRDFWEGKKNFVEGCKKSLRVHKKVRKRSKKQNLLSPLGWEDKKCLITMCVCVCVRVWMMNIIKLLLLCWFFSWFFRVGGEKSFI